MDKLKLFIIPLVIVVFIFLPIIIDYQNCIHISLILNRINIDKNTMYLAYYPFLGSIIAVFGTWYFTTNSFLKEKEHLKKINLKNRMLDNELIISMINKTENLILYLNDGVCDNSDPIVKAYKRISNNIDDKYVVNMVGIKSFNYKDLNLVDFYIKESKEFLSNNLKEKLNVILDKETDNKIYKNHYAVYERKNFYYDLNCINDTNKEMFLIVDYNIFEKFILSANVGNKDNNVSGVIEKLNNQDLVDNSLVKTLELNGDFSKCDIDIIEQELIKRNCKKLCVSLVRFDDKGYFPFEENKTTLIYSNELSNLLTEIIDELGR